MIKVLVSEKHLLTQVLFNTIIILRVKIVELRLLERETGYKNSLLFFLKDSRWNLINA